MDNNYAPTMYNWTPKMVNQQDNPKFAMLCFVL